MPQNSPNHANRVRSLDLFRFVAVTLAILSHALVYWSWQEKANDWTWLLFRCASRTAMPALLILFGIMLEITYSKKFEKDPHETTQRLIYRSIICYMALAMLATASLLFQEDYGFIKYIAGLTLFGIVPMGNLFKFYFILLLFTPLLLIIRNRLGILFLFLLSAIPHLVSYLLNFNRIPIPQPLTHLAAFLFGLGGNWGPSIFHCILLVSFGMSLGRVLYSGTTEIKKQDYLLPCTVGAISVMILALEISKYGAVQFLHKIEDLKSYRAVNHPAYYAYGIIGSLALCLIGKGLSYLKRQSEFLSKVGGNSFSYFFSANLLLLLLPKSFKNLSTLSLFGVILAFVISSSGITIFWSKIKHNPHVRKIFMPAKMISHLIIVYWNKLAKFKSLRGNIKKLSR